MTCIGPLLSQIDIFKYIVDWMKGRIGIFSKY